MLDLVEEAFDEVALAIEGEVGFAWLLAVRLRRNDGRDLSLSECVDERVRVVALVGDQRVGLEVFEQRLGLRDVGGLSGRERQRDRIAECIDDGVDLGCQSAARAADGLVSAVFFWAPALC
jgi:hypothetical protein